MNRIAGMAGITHWTTESAVSEPEQATYSGCNSGDRTGQDSKHRLYATRIKDFVERLLGMRAVCVKWYRGYRNLIID